jgi:hypothetical protein
MKKALITACSLLVSSLSFGQTANVYGPETGFYWIDGKTVTLAYSNAGAPAAVPNSMMLQVLADIEAKLDGLKVPGLEVAIDTNVRNTTCDEHQRNQVLVCWEAITGQTGNFHPKTGMEGTTAWQSADVVLDKQTTWTRDAMYAQLMHQLLHVLGFGHPEGSNNSVLNGAADLTAIDTAGLQAYYNTRCVYMYNPADKTVVLPFVTYRGNAYNVTVHNDGNNNFSLTKVSMWTPATPPKTPCQSLAVDGNNDLHIPAVNVGGASIWADLRVQNGSLVLRNSGRN